MHDPTPASGQEAQDLARRMFEIFECDENPMIRDLLTQVLTRALDARTQATARTCAKEIETFSMAILTGETGQNLSNPITVSEILKLMSSKIRHTFGLRDESTSGGRP